MNFYPVILKKTPKLSKRFPSNTLTGVTEGVELAIVSVREYKNVCEKKMGVFVLIEVQLADQLV